MSRPSRLIGLLIALCLLVSACVSQEEPSSAPASASLAPSGGSTAPNASLPGSTLPPLPTGPDALRLEQFAEGLDAPIGLTSAGDGSGRLYVNEQAGRVRIVEKDGSLREQPFVDLTDRVGSGGERGLLGLAFHPRYADNRRLFVNYTDRDGNTVISELTASADGLSADPASEKVLLQVEQPYANHNGGELAFGPDGYLYIGLGDGGSAGDPHGNGQNRDVLLGKLLRIDVDATPTDGKPYAIPADNPFAAGGGAPEVWAYGLRNPWRFSFDVQTGDLYIGDVGQGQWEEIDRQPAGSPGGENYGWNVMEGRHCYGATSCDQRPYLPPIAEYSHEGGNCSVTGGEVYRGTAQPELAGIYVFGDYCSGRLFTLNVDEGTIVPKEVLKSDAAISSFGTAEDGEIYLTDQSSGRLYHVVVGG
jgi:glucose/arabinose dehydrogenase